MIRLTRAEKPKELTTEVQERLTREFVDSGKQKTVWKKQWIADALLASSYGKCAFSEVRLGEEGKYMEVEHFFPKSRYPELVVEWTNLLPILNVCNTKKGDWDTGKRPLVNPMDEDPKLFFVMRNGRISPRNYRDRKAIDTIERYGLNNNDQLRVPRQKVECKSKQLLSEIKEHYGENKEYNGKRLLTLMVGSGRKSDYAATKSTVILLSEDYAELKAMLTGDGLWNKAFDMAEEELRFCALI